jgi:hypothetical protein
MLFNFQLHPLEDIPPWGHEGDYHLGWFGLTDSFYWLNVGEQELFRYTKEALETTWGEDINPIKPLPYADYYAVRLWEDIQEILPDILEPIPQSLLQIVEPGLQSESWYRHLADKTFPDDDEFEASDEVETAFETAARWLHQRYLHTSYLKYGPRIWFWTDGETLFISWANEDLKHEGFQVWTAITGRLAMPLQSFIDEVLSFDRRLIEAMEKRVESIRQHWPRTDIQIDIDGLVREHEDRATWMAQTLEKARTKTPVQWNEVIHAIELLEKFER